jgi:hypothetical protein
MQEGLCHTKATLFLNREVLKDLIMMSKSLGATSKPVASTSMLLLSSVKTGIDPGVIIQSEIGKVGEKSVLINL